MAFCVWKNEEKGECFCDGKPCRFRVVGCALADLGRTFHKLIKGLFSS